MTDRTAICIHEKTKITFYEVITRYSSNRIIISELYTSPGERSIHSLNTILMPHLPALGPNLAIPPKAQPLSIKMKGKVYTSLLSWVGQIA